jgi:beta-aspartyl-peptidase (threonine type)
MFLARLVPAALALLLSAPPAMAQEPPRWSFAIHGGAGVIERASLTPPNRTQPIAPRCTSALAGRAGDAGRTAARRMDAVPGRRSR